MERVDMWMPYREYVAWKLFRDNPGKYRGDDGNELFLIDMEQELDKAEKEGKIVKRDIAP